MAMMVSFPVKQMLSLFRESNTDEMWLDYDEEADALYVNFHRPVAADHSEMDDDDTIVRYREGRVIGLTIMNASTKQEIMPSIK